MLLLSSVLSDSCIPLTVLRFSQRLSAWQRRQPRQQQPQRRERRWRQRRHESECHGYVSTGLFQFLTACIFTRACSLMTCTWIASDVLGKGWTSKSKACMHMFLSGFSFSHYNPKNRRPLLACPICTKFEAERGSHESPRVHIKSGRRHTLPDAFYKGVEPL